MPVRRVLSLWFPRLGAERLIRQARGGLDVPLAVLRDTGQMQVISSMNALAEAEGLQVGQPLRDAQAVCPALVTRLQNVQAEAAFLTVLRRWAGKFSPWVAEAPPTGLVIDLTGCAHLFGGEEALLGVVGQDCADLGLTVQAGIADTLGAAWALARFAGQPGPQSHRNGDAIDQEARATRSRAVKRRHWTRGGAPPRVAMPAAPPGRIARPGQTRIALSPLPVAALRLEGDTQEQLSRLGLRRIGDLIGQPRAALARRFGKGLVLRLDQALGAVPEPVSPAKPSFHFAVRMTLPDPIGLEEDIMAGIDRLLPRLCKHLTDKGQGARLVRFQAFRTDQTMQSIEVGLARASDDPDRLRPLLRMKLDEIDAGFGIDMLRLEVIRSEPIHQRRMTGHLDAGRAVSDRLASNTAIDDLIGRVGARIGLERITRRHPASSNIPEKTAQVLAAAWSEPFSGKWPETPTRRPLLMWPPEPVSAPESPVVPDRFRWRGRELELDLALGPERIAPEWWLDDPNWRSGVRDYWRVTCTSGDRLWLFFAHGGAMSAGWFCHGAFA
ncbi:DNA polymerase Y family protein [Shimia biformata]|uniref:Y-family DNA polymerase n=1 Tax=Shimia biformata TaxID=1294299 RepID=UPI0019521662|nr:DNA polymerase Y family protein [Shimia biformata]